MQDNEFYLQPDDVITKLKSQHKCECGCPYQECLEFHHFKKKYKTIGACNREELLDELAKCVLICANCHTRIHKGTLPNPTITNIDIELARAILNTKVAYTIGRKGSLRRSVEQAKN